MNLRRVRIAPDSDLAHEAFVVGLPSAPHLDALVMKFRGAYGHGSEGNGDAAYMAAVTRAAISFTDPFALIFDFTELRYEWGDMMSQVLCAGERRGRGDLPMAIVVSAGCEPSIRSLLTREMGMEDLGLVHHGVESALGHVDGENKLG